MKKEEVKKDKAIEKPDSERQRDVIHYDYGHLVIYCGNCGSKYILKENVPKNEAVQIVLSPTNVHELRLICKDCKNEMGLFYIESSKKDEKPTEEDTKETVEGGTENEPVSEESTTEAAAV